MTETQQDREQAVLDILAGWDWANGDLTLTAAQAVEVRLAMLEVRSLRRQITSLRDAVEKAAPVIRAVWDACVVKLVPMWSVVEPYLAQDAPMGTEWDAQVQAGYETLPKREPRHGDRAFCAVCAGEIKYVEETAWNGMENDVLNSWWAHRDHPKADHDAVPGDLR